MQRNGSAPRSVDQVAVAPKTDIPSPAPALRATISPAQPAADDHPIDANARNFSEAQIADVQPLDKPAPPSPVKGVFPTTVSDPTDELGAPNLALYLDDHASDQTAALALAIAAQRRFGAALGGGRFSYKRIRVAENDVWRLRVAGLSRERADQMCKAVTEMGGACEVGPK